MEKEQTITDQDRAALKVVLDFVERWNKEDKEIEVAQAASYLECLL